MDNPKYTCEDWLDGKAVHLGGKDDATWVHRRERSLFDENYMDKEEFEKVQSIQKKCFSLVKNDRVKYHVNKLYEDLESAPDKREYLSGRKRVILKALDQLHEEVQRKVRAGEWHWEGLTSQMCKKILQGPKPFRNIPGTEMLPIPAGNEVLKHAIQYEIVLEINQLLERVDLQKKGESLTKNPVKEVIHQIALRRSKRPNSHDYETIADTLSFYENNPGFQGKEIAKKFEVKENTFSTWKKELDEKLK